MKPSRIKLIGASLLTVGLMVVGGNLGSGGQAHAYSNSNIIDDSVFDSTSSMSAGQIQTFLNQFPNSCLKSYSAPDPQSWYTYGGMVSAAQVIKDASTMWGLSPRVILTTLQKEEQLVNGSQGCANWRYWSAMGYNCPGNPGNVYSQAQATASPNNYTGGIPADMQGSIGPTCVASPISVGFSAQVSHGAWQLEFGRQRSEGNGNLSWDGDGNITYFGYMTAGCRARVQGGSTTCYSGNITLSDGTNLTVANGATASLYSYTPFLQSFDTIFEGFFGAGSTTGVPYSASFYSQSSYPAINPGGSATSFFEYQNSGNQTWYDDTSAAGASALPVHLATAGPLNKSSVFGSSWGPNHNRPATVFAAVYLSDGVTLASDQHVATPGQIVKFSFIFNVPAQQAAGSYEEDFQPVLEGSSNGAFANPGTYLMVGVNTIYSAAYSSEGSFPSLQPGQAGSSFISYQNSGNIPWYDDASVSGTGALPVHLATAHALNRASIFGSAWGANHNRPATQFSAVYESDGVTLASNQHIVQSGQIAKFATTFATPINQAAGNYQEYFQPVLEGSDNGVFADTNTFLTPAVITAGVGASANGNPSSFSLAPGTTQSVTLHFTDVGNQAWTGSTHLLADGSSDAASFQDSSWGNGYVVAMTESSVAIGGTGTFSFIIKTPLTGGTYTLRFAPSNGAAFFGDPPASITVTVAAANYSASYAGQSSYPNLMDGGSSAGYFKYTNSGNVPWFDDTSAAGASALPVHLATAGPLNKSSVFGSSWGPNHNRPATVFAAVYLSDGVTLASDQHVATPGQIVKFSFIFNVPAQQAAGSYEEDFQPVLEGSSNGAFANPGTYLMVGVAAPTYTAAYVGQSSYPTIVAGNTATGSFSYKNVGNVAWYDNTSLGGAPAGAYPVHLATNQPINRSSVFGATWGAGHNRPNLTFSAVYESDGVTLAVNQHIVQPGQIAKFSFTFTVVSNQTPGVYREFFMPIAEGTPNGAFGDPGTYLDVTVQSS